MKKTPAAASMPQNGRAPTGSAQKPPQRRELWVLSCFLIAILLSLVVFVKDGVLVAWLNELLLGLFGWGVYLMPFAALAACMVILFARGKPVAAQLTALALLPFLVSVAIHLFLCTDKYTWENALLLYTAGTKLVSGGLIAGGFAVILSSIISHVGATIVTLLFIIVAFLLLFKVRLLDVTTWILDMRDEGKRLRNEAAYDNYESSTGYTIKEAPDPVEPPVRSDPMSANTQPGRDRLIDLPLDDEPVRTSAAESSNRRRHTQEPISEPESAPIPERYSRTPDLPLEPVAPIRPRVTPAVLPDVPVPEGVPSYTTVSDDPEPPARISDAAPVSHEFLRASGLHETQTHADELHEVPVDVPAFALNRWAKTPEQLEEEERAAGVFADPATGEVVEHTSYDEPEDDLPASLPSEQTHTMPVTEPVVVDTHMQAEKPAARDVTPPPSEVPARSDERLPYEYPPVTLLKQDKSPHSDDATEELRMRSQTLTDTLSSFGVQAHITGVIRGPSVTRYEMQLERGVKLSRITTLQNDIALALGATAVRIAPIPDKQAVGIEVPNKVVQLVYLRDVLLSQNMMAQKSRVAFALGRDITGESIVADIHKMPHLLIAGTTGSGKSVCINSIIVSLLYRASPEDVRFIMIDPKMVELNAFNGIPHLLIPVVTDIKKAAGALGWAVTEMERRYKLMAAAGARDLQAYNRIISERGEEPLPRVVIIIDELADLMMMAAKEVEESICRIAQKARAAGMHLIIATQRPSADVLTGLMKSNIPSRIAFAVSSQIESRIILDQGGADRLIGRGDMLFLPIGAGKPMRVQGCFLSDGEIENITEFIKENNTVEYSQDIIDQIDNAGKENGAEVDPDDESDPMLGDAVDVIMETGQASASMLQRRLRLGYARAARIIDQMEARGFIGAYDGSKPRQILISRQDWQEMKLRYGARS
ncbi:MAG: DNA translocase FtsK 4TM domain-containing protein [Eubacteriales bacterium]